MIANVSTSRDVSGTVKYVMKERSSLLDKNTLGTQADTVVRGMKSYADASQASVEALHLSLSYHPQEELSPRDRVANFEAFCEQWGIDTDNHPYVLVSHNDTEHPHDHAVIAHTGRDGSTLDLSWMKYRAKEAARVVEKERGLRPTAEERSLHFDKGELELMGREQRPTEKFKNWVEEKGSEHGVDLDRWSAEDWRQFANAPGRFLNQIKAELDERKSAPALSPQVENQPSPSASPTSGRDEMPLGEGTFGETSQLDTQDVAAGKERELQTPPSSQLGADAGVSEPPSQSGAKVELPSSLQPPLDLETLAEDPQQAKATLRRIYDSYQHGQGEVKVARALLDAGYDSEAAAAIVGQSPHLEAMGDSEERVEQTRSTVNQAAQAYNREKEQELRVALVAPICEALLDEVGASEFEGTRHILKRDGEFLRLYDRQGELLMEAQRNRDGQWHSDGRSNISRGLARYFQQKVAPHLQKQLELVKPQPTRQPEMELG